ncbi:copper-transporting ATPase PAA1, chloroplastic-like, partial [Oryza brachyantha]|uniref:copper-transporting ATPase PAA1, chloroplastic-like n=1 Tax=Oryza brachyantha TaxID=4533 RepID=UPI001ADAC97F
GGGGGGGGGDGDAAAAAAVAAAAALEETEAADGDVILLRVGGMSCGGCAAAVKRILESQPEVTSATVDFERKTAAVWATPEAKATKDWQKQLGEKLAHHLSASGFQSHLLDEDEPDSGSQQ